MGNIPQETIMDKHCVGCKYYAGITEYIWYCSYFAKEDKLRPCPPGKGCTVRIDKAGYQPKPQKPKERKKVIPKNTGYYTYKGETKTLAEWSKIVGVNDRTLYYRIKRMGWSVEKAMETPAMTTGNGKKKEGVKDA